MQQKAPASLGGVVHEEGYTSLCLFSTWHNGVMVSQMSASHSILSKRCSGSSPGYAVCR